MQPRLKPVNDTVDFSATTIGNKIAWRSAGPSKGRGIFALVDFRAGEVVEQSPVTIVSKAESDFIEGFSEIEDSRINQYLLRWQPNIMGQEACMGHGYLMVYNHSRHPNGDFRYDFAGETISMVAIRDIKAGEEICYDYDCDLWFDSE